MTSQATRPIRVLIVDDHTTACAGIRAILAPVPDICVVGEASTNAEARTLVAQLRPTILLLDLVLPDARPYETERWVREHYPETITLVLTGHDRDHLLYQGVRAGVAGYLTKEQPSHHLVDAIRRAANWENLLTADQHKRAQSWQANVGARWAGLTGREQEILLFMARGFTNRRIAEMLGITEGTVKQHLTRSYSKLGVPTRAAALNWIWEHNVAEFHPAPSGASSDSERDDDPESCKDITKVI